MGDLYDDFHARFQVLFGDDDAVRDQAHQLRYQVYCRERGHDSEVVVVNNRERDEFDPDSMHIVVRDRRDGFDKGTVRVVTAGADRLGRFPIEHTYPTLLSDYGIDEDVLPRAKTAEISRFAISKELRERAGDRSRSERSERSERRSDRRAERGADRLDTRQRSLPGGAANRRPMVTFGLFLGLAQLGAENDFTHCIAVMKPSLLRMLARFGLKFTTIGPPIEYHGLRQPCYANVSELVRGVTTRNPDLWRLMSDNERLLSSVTSQTSQAANWDEYSLRSHARPSAV